jgi:hypothetical protein
LKLHDKIVISEARGVNWRGCVILTQRGAISRDFMG